MGHRIYGDPDNYYRDEDDDFWERELTDEEQAIYEFDDDETA